MSAPLLSVEGLSLDFLTRGGRVQALEDVGFTVGKGEIVGIVGESGSGKSVLSFAIMGLLAAAARIRAGSIRFEGIDLLVAGDAMADLRGRELSMIFQSPRTALNPIRRVGRQIEDVLLRHGSVLRKDARGRRSRRSRACAFRTRSGAMTPIRSSFPAACVSA